MTDQTESQRLRDAADAAWEAERAADAAYAAKDAAYAAWEAARAAWEAQNQRFLEIVGARGGSK